MLRDIQPAKEKAVEQKSLSEPDVQTEAGKSSRRKGPITSEACDWCRKKKAKCSGPPRCHSCILRSLTCTFNYHESKRRVVTVEDYESLQVKLHGLEATIEVLRTGTKNEVMQELRRLRDDPAIVADVEDAAMVLDSQDSNLTQTPTTLAYSGWQLDNEDSNRDLAAELPVSGTNIEVDFSEDLPTEADVLTAKTALHDPAATMFFIMTATESDRVLAGLRGKSSAKISRADACLACAFCALGSHFNPGDNAAPSGRSLFRTAWMLINDCFEVSGLQSLHALLCLALYTLLEKKSSVRVMLASGLQIARWLVSSRSLAALGPEGLDSFRMTYRSIVLLDSYLSTKLVHNSTVSTEEMEYVVNPTGTGCFSSEDIFVSELNTLAFCLRNLSTQLHEEGQLDLTIINGYVHELNLWHGALPEGMRLATLTTPEQRNVPNGMWTAILYLHEAYLSALVLLYQGLIPKLLQQKMAGNEWGVQGSLESADECYAQTMITAQQCIRINTLLAYMTSAVFRRCWLLLCELFTCSCLLLADISLKIFIGSSDGVEEDLHCISSAADTMRHMRGEARMTAAFLRLMEPLRSELEALHRARLQASRPHAELSQAARDYLQQTVQILWNITRHQSKHSLADAATTSMDLSHWRREDSGLAAG